MKERETFASRLGFVLISAGCAIGLGNVWRFPYIVGQYGGAAFVLIYLLFLVIMGLPIMAMEFSVGRASRKSILASFQVLEPKGSKWHWYGWFGMAGNYLLMMFYTTIAGWLLLYFFKVAAGEFRGLDAAGVETAFGAMQGNVGIQLLFMGIVVVLGMLICSRGLKNGVEKVNKAMMLCLLALLVVLAVRALTLPGAMEGVKFYLVPNFHNLMYDADGNFRLFRAIYDAMGQAFFTLSLGIGAMAIFGSYIGKERRLFGEAINVGVLDTCVAFVSGLIIFPSAFAFGVNPGQGPSLIFVTLPNVFNAMPGGQLWGALFFVFLFFAALSTVTAVFENILACWMDTLRYLPWQGGTGQSGAHPPAEPALSAGQQPVERREGPGHGHYGLGGFPGEQQPAPHRLHDLPAVLLCIQKVRLGLRPLPGRSKPGQRRPLPRPVPPLLQVRPARHCAHHLHHGLLGQVQALYRGRPRRLTTEKTPAGLIRQEFFHAPPRCRGGQLPAPPRLRQAGVDRAPLRTVGWPPGRRRPAHTALRRTRRMGTGT